MVEIGWALVVVVNRLGLIQSRELEKVWNVVKRVWNFG